MEHRDHCSVFIRQFHHRLVQPFLQLGEVGFPHRTVGCRRLQEFLVVLDAGINIVEAGSEYQTNTTVAMDAVAEVKVLTSNYQAEFGRKAGGSEIL